MKLVVVSEHPCCRIGLATILNGVDAAATIVEAKSIDELVDRKSTRLNSSHMSESRMPSSA